MRSVHYLVLALFLLLAQCASKSRTASEAELEAASKVEPEARPVFLKAEAAYQQKNYDLALRRYRAIRTKFPRTQAHAISQYRIGSILYYKGDYPTAAREFEAFLNQFQNSELGFDVTYNLAAAEYQMGRFERSHQFLSRLAPEAVEAQGPRRAELVYQLSAQNAEALGNYPLALSLIGRQLRLPLEEAQRNKLQDKSALLISRMGSKEDLLRLSNEISDPGVRARLQERLVLLSPPPSVPAVSIVETNGVKDLPLASNSSGERSNVGVILPLSGKFAAYGRRALDGILLAAKMFEAGSDLELNLYIEDSGSNPIRAAAAAEKLYRQYEVMAIIGPLNAREAVTVASASQQLGVMNLSLSSKLGVSEHGAYIFQNAFTPRVQLEPLVDFVVSKRGYKRFAILAPDNAFGSDMANQFWDLVEGHGAKVVAFESYPADEKDFQLYAQRLVGLNDPKLRKMEWDKLQEYIKEQKIKPGREKKMKLQPIVDFEAIFVPDSPKAVGSLAGSLAYFDVSGAPLLGTAEWHSDQLYKRGGRFVEGALFPVGFSLTNPTLAQRQFSKIFSDSYGSQPDLLAAQAYEAMQIVSYAVLKGSSSRNDVVRNVASLQEVESPLGVLSFAASRTASRRIPVFTVGVNGALIEAN